MLNYIIADLKRITLRIPRAIAMLVIYAGMVLFLMSVSSSDQWNVVSYMSAVEQYVGFLMVMIGLVELVSIFADDFKAKTMQVAIGLGIPRWRVILCKLIEVMVLVLADLVVFALVAFIAAPCVRVAPSGSRMMEIIGKLFGVWLGTTAFASLSMILIFITQGTLGAIILYLAMASGVVNTLMEIILGLEGIKDFHLQRFTLTALVKMFDAKIILGTFSFSYFVGILIYIAIGYAVTLAVFRKRELDF